MTVLIFIARAFIAGGFQAAYVYTPEVRRLPGLSDVFLLFLALSKIKNQIQPTQFFFLNLQVYPTATRALGLGMSSGMARVGALITPFVAQVTPISQYCFFLRHQNKRK